MTLLPALRQSGLRSGGNRTDDDMRDLLLNALRRNLEAAEKRGDMALADRLRARLPVPNGIAPMPDDPVAPPPLPAPVARKRGRPRKAFAPLIDEELESVADHPAVETIPDEDQEYT